MRLRAVFGSSLGCLVVSAACFGVSSLFPYHQHPLRGLETTANPKVVTERSEVQLGTLLPGGTVKARFALKNIASSPLSIKSVTTECGCIQVQDAPATLMPGELSNIFISVNTSEVGLADFRKQAMVQFFDGPENKLPPILLTVSGTIDNEHTLAVYPASLDFGDVEPGHAVTKTIYLHASESLLSALPAAIDVVSPNTTFDIAYNPKSRRLGERPIKITLHCPLESSVGNNKSSFYLNFVSSNPRIISLPYSFNVVDKLNFEPKSLVLNAVSHAECYLTLRSVDSTSISLRKAESNLPISCRVISKESSDILILAIRCQSEPDNAVTTLELDIKVGESSTKINVPVIVYSQPVH
jgi:hypothetical protein